MRDLQDVLYVNILMFSPYRVQPSVRPLSDAQILAASPKGTPVNQVLHVHGQFFVSFFLYLCVRTCTTAGKNFTLFLVRKNRYIVSTGGNVR